MRDEVLEHRFVERFPDELEPGVLYVSIEYASVAHSCCCGCGEEVVTPLTPTDWKITYDGETVTLQPSVGSWTLPCRSHYVIRRNRVFEAPPWSDEDVAAERRRDREAKACYFNQQAPNFGAVGHQSPKHEPMASGRPPKAGWRKRLSGWFRSGRS